MAALTTVLAGDNTTDALFRTWGKAISDQMAAGGWIKTADIGQIDWATVLKPAAVNTSQGYEIWRSNDAAGSLNQIYVKIEYGSGVAAVAPGLWLTVAFGSNGSGALTGFMSTRTQLAAAGSATPAGLNSYLSVTPGRFSFNMFSQSAYVISFHVERTLDISLNPKNEVLIIGWGGNPTLMNYRQVVSQTEGVFPIVTSNTIAVALTDANSLQSGAIGLALIFGQRGALTSPSTNNLGVYSTNLGAAGTVVAIPIYEVNVNYICLGSVPTLTAPVYMISRYD